MWYVSSIYVVVTYVGRTRFITSFFWGVGRGNLARGTEDHMLTCDDPESRMKLFTDSVTPSLPMKKRDLDSDSSCNTSWFRVKMNTSKTSFHYH